MTPIDHRHQLTEQQFDALASGRHDPRALGALMAGQHSRRLLMLRAFLDYARSNEDCRGPLAPIGTAWQLLTRAERTDPVAVAAIVDHPQVGLWVAHALRRLRGSAADLAPLWFHVGRLHAVAVAAALRAGVDFELAVPAQDGIATLPTLGYACVDAALPWDTVEIRAEAGAVEVRHGTDVVRVPTELSAPGPGWHPLRLLAAEADGKVLSLRLDDVDPYRGLDSPVPPRPVAPDEVERWRDLTRDAWRLLVDDHAEQAEELAMGMTTVVPVPNSAPFRVYSGSVENGFGCALMSEPQDAAQFAVTLIHEFQHSKLSGIQHLVTLREGAQPARLYAPWRDDPRPLGGLLQGVYAFTSVTEFWATHRQRVHGTAAQLAEFEFALWRSQTLTSLRGLHGHAGLTEFGHRFLAEVTARLARLPEVESRLAAAVADDHRASWRACHLRPDPALAERLSDAWVRGESTLPEIDYRTTVVPDPTAQRLDIKGLLTRLRITDPATFEELQSAPGRMTGASAADLAYVAGKLPEARELYLAELADSPERAAAWSGLGLTLAATGSAGSDVLLRRPELVKAVYLRARAVSGDAPEPARLAAWLGSAA